MKKIALCRMVFVAFSCLVLTSASFAQVETSNDSLVVLPFDISDNSSVTHSDIAHMNGFRGYRLGTSYADGAAKFETVHAGEASLVAHLDSAPDTLVFELKGNKSGSAPAAYEGVVFTISYSADSIQWAPMATLYDADISTSDYTRFTYRVPGSDTRYVQWKLENSTKGNTRLNNIRITQRGESGDSSGITDYHPETFGVYPNPTPSAFNIYVGRNQITSLILYNIYGQIVREWNNPTPEERYNIFDLPRGTYILKANTPNGTIQKKVVRY